MTTGIEICRKWLDAGYIEPRKTFNKSMSSYSFKHFVEYWAGQYITNEDFIQAVIEKGYKVEPIEEGHPNYLFNWAFCKGHDWYSVHKGL